MGILIKTKTLEKRPILNKQISVEDFREFYWLKEELQTFCKQEKLKRTGSKIEIANRIEYYLKTGKAPEAANKRVKKISKFDWNTEQLELTTIITDSYKNSENVRQFFSKEIGKSFKFNVKFMNWMKSNNGKTLEDAIAEWKNIDKAKKTNKSPKDIAPQFEYNRYLRDFLADNPNRNRQEGIELWKLKKSIRGNNVYEKSDFKLLKNEKNT